MDQNTRCPWCGTDPLYVDYHDTVWGRPEYDELALFEKLCLDGQQAGLSWITIREACITTLKAASMVLWIVFGATVFVGLYVVEGGQTFVQDALAATGLDRWGILIIMMIILVALGMFLDWVGILLLCVPIFVPVVQGLGFDPLWFGVLYLVNMQMSFLSPPFGPAAFYLKSVAPPDISLGDIFRSLLPFIGMQALAVAVLILFPAIAIY